MIYFPHIPKAGGSTLLNLFLANFHRSNILCVYSIGNHLDFTPAEFPNIGASNLEGISIVAGHLPVARFLENPFASKLFDSGDVEIISSVRDPVDRLVSLRNYILVRPKHPGFEKVSAMSEEDFFLSEPKNFQYEYLKPALGNKLYIYPIEKSVGAFSQKLASYFKRSIESVPIANKASKASMEGFSKRENLDEKLVNWLYANHSKDSMLYDQARVALI